MEYKYIPFIPQPLLKEIRNNNVVPFLGAGFSKNAEVSVGLDLPDWNELGDYIKEHLSNYESENALDIISQYESLYSRDELVKLIKTRIGDVEIEPGETHINFGKIFQRLICTTNFDNLLEKTYENLEINFTKISSEKELPKVNYDSPCIVKLHGDFECPDDMVLTENDYDMYLTNKPLFSTFIGNVFITKTLLLIGYSLSDNDIRSLLSVINYRLGKMTKSAYVFLVNERESVVERFIRRGINPINIIEGEKTVKETYAGVFEEIKHYVDEHNNFCEKPYQEFWINNHLGRYLGKDPWGESLEICLGKKDGRIIAKWINRMTNLGLERESVIILIEEINADFNEKLFCEFNISLLKEVEDTFPKKQIDYSYEGVLLLAEGSLTVTFIGGQCRYYYPEGGVNGNYSGGFRNGANLLTVLDYQNE